MKQARKVYHVYFRGKDKHYYFGSIASIFENFTEKRLGVKAKTIYYDHDFGLGRYQNNKVIIRLGYLITKEGNRGIKK